MNGYESILYLNHYEPRYHPRMSMKSRSGQFAPYSSLSGYEDGIREEARRVDSYREQVEEEYQILNQKFSFLINHLSEIVEVKVYYFEKDPYKDGGKYCWYQGRIKKIDLDNRIITFQDSWKLSLDVIMDIQYNLDEVSYEKN